MKRCKWDGEDALYIAYHGTEWAVPVHNDDNLFEMLILFIVAATVIFWRSRLGSLQSSFYAVVPPAQRDTDPC